MMTTPLKIKILDINKKELNDQDYSNLIKFIDKNNLSREELKIYLHYRFIAMPFSLGEKVSYNSKFLKFHIASFLEDLDFGPVDRLLRKFRKSMVLKNSKRKHEVVLLDVGCGRQASLGWDMRKRLKKYYGLDRDIPEVTLKNLEFINSTAEEMHKRLGNNSIDVITALAVIEHIEDPEAFAKTCYKLLKPGGEIYFTTPLPFTDSFLKFISSIGVINGDEIEEHKTYFTPSTLSNLLEKVGFEIVKKQRFLFGVNGFVLAVKK